MLLLNIFTGMYMYVYMYNVQLNHYRILDTIFFFPQNFILRCLAVWHSDIQALFLFALKYL